MDTTDNLATVTLLLTVSILPWFLGGTIPLAGLALQAGAVTAWVLSLPGLIAGSGRPARIPLLCVPLLIFVAIGIFQLIPIHESVIAGMDHAVLPENRSALSQNLTDRSGPLTASPADTRTAVAQLLALTLLSTTAFTVLRSRRRIKATLWVLSANAAALATVGFLQQFRGDSLLLGNVWWTGRGRPFATFVNPNNAAGWLCIGLAAAIGLIGTLASGGRRSQGAMNYSGLVSVSDGLLYRISNLTVWQLVAWVSMGLIGAGIAATGSRGGVVAGIVAVLSLSVRRPSIRHVSGGVVLAAVAVAAAWGLLVLFQMDRAVVTEMRTLDEPLTAAGGRLAHWSDTLVMLRDFPAVGSGLKAYKYATLPYQKHDFQLWMQNADNQYVEVLIESGITGFAAFIALGLIGAATAWKLCQHSGGSQDYSQSQHGLALALGSANLAMVASLAFAALTDFGISLVSTSAAFVLVSSVCSAALSGLRNRGRTQQNSEHTAQGLSRWLTIRVSGTSLLALSFCLAVAAASFLPDLWLASQNYQHIVAAYRCQSADVTVSLLDQQHQVYENLTHAVSRRPDAPEPRRMLLQMQEDVLRQNILQKAIGREGITDENLQQLWELTGPLALHERFNQLSQTGSAAAAGQLADQISQLMKESGFLQGCAQAEQQFPLMPAVAHRTVLWKWVGRKADDAFYQQVRRSMFVEPHDAGMLFQLGFVSLRLGDQQLATDLWTRSNALSGRFRGRILTDATIHMPPEQAWNRFGPLDFEQCVETLQRAGTPEIRERLIQRANEFWEEPTSQPSHRTIQLRNEFLIRTGQPDQLIEWYKQCLEWTPEETSVRAQLASLLEREQRYQESLEEWRRILFFDDRYPDAPSAISRLQRRLHESKE